MPKIEIKWNINLRNSIGFVIFFGHKLAIAISFKIYPSLLRNMALKLAILTPNINKSPIKLRNPKAKT